MCGRSSRSHGGEMVLGGSSDTSYLTSGCPSFPQMLSSVLAALIGIAGSGYCVIVAALGLAEGPICVDASGQWNYTFASTEGQ